MKKKVVSVLLCGLLGASLFAAGCGSSDDSSSDSSASTSAESESSEDVSYEGVTLSLLIDTDTTDTGVIAVCDAATEALGMEFDIQYRVGGDEGDNLVKTELASGDMCDIMVYNSGALLSALNPSEYLYDLSDNETIMAALDETYASTVTVDGATYGIPMSSSQAGAVMYNKEIYEEYGLEVPETWDEFISNCEVLQDAGETALIGSFADSWTTQVIFLGDNANVIAQDPDFAENLTNGEDTYAGNEFALRSFEKMAELNAYYNEDYLATSYDDACDMLINGDGAQWICLTQALSNMYELYGDEVNNIGVFAIPADDAEDTNLTVWMPSSLYLNASCENIDAAIAFFEFYISEEGLDTYTSTILPDGPYCINDYEVPETAYTAVAEDMQAYFDNGNTGLAMEFLTDVKGSSCMDICQECGSGQTTAEEAAAKYDDDCLLQAQQLGYEWAQ